MTIPRDYARCPGKYNNVDHHGYEGNEMNTVNEIMELADRYAYAAVRDYLSGEGEASHHCDKLRTAIEKLAADARRYQFLFAGNKVYSQFFTVYDLWDGQDGKVGFDAAIDASMREST